MHCLLVYTRLNIQVLIFLQRMHGSWICDEGLLNWGKATPVAGQSRSLIIFAIGKSFGFLHILSGQSCPYIFKFHYCWDVICNVLSLKAYRTQVQILGRPLCDAPDWHRDKYTMWPWPNKNKWRPNRPRKNIEVYSSAHDSIHTRNNKSIENCPPTPKITEEIGSKRRKKLWKA